MLRKPSLLRVVGVFLASLTDVSPDSLAFFAVPNKGFIGKILFLSGPDSNHF